MEVEMEGISMSDAEVEQWERRAGVWMDENGTEEWLEWAAAVMPRTKEERERKEMERIAADVAAAKEAQEEANRGIEQVLRGAEERQRSDLARLLEEIRVEDEEVKKKEEEDEKVWLALQESWGRKWAAFGRRKAEEQHRREDARLKAFNDARAVYQARYTRSEIGREEYKVGASKAQEEQREKEERDREEMQREFEEERKRMEEEEKEERAKCGWKGKAVERREGVPRGGGRGVGVTRGRGAGRGKMTRAPIIAMTPGNHAARIAEEKKKLEQAAGGSGEGAPIEGITVSQGK
jgi:hypothetical protein